MSRKRVGILIFPSVEVLDFCGPFEVFSVTRLDEERRREESSPFEVARCSMSIIYPPGRTRMNDTSPCRAALRRRRTRRSGEDHDCRTECEPRLPRRVGAEMGNSAESRKRGPTGSRVQVPCCHRSAGPVKPGSVRCC